MITEEELDKLEEDRQRLSYEIEEVIAESRFLWGMIE